MNGQPAVSIIVPIYKAQEYLPRCLDSILEQTFTDFELICIDDGSPDDCARILREYADRDARLRVINQRNQGQSVARNQGLREARGRYIYFVDSDDYIHPQLLEITHYFITRYEADWVIFNHHKKQRKAVKRSNRWKLSGPPPAMPEYFEDFARIPFKLTSDPMLFFGRKDGYKAANYVWARLYRRELLEDQEFIPGIHNEDMAFIFALYRKHPKTVFLNVPLYSYNYNAESIVNTAHRNPARDIQDMHVALLSVYSVYRDAPRKEFDFVSGEVVLKYLKDQLTIIRKADRSERPRLYELFIREAQDLHDRHFIGFRWKRMIPYLQVRRLLKTSGHWYSRRPSREGGPS